MAVMMYMNGRADLGVMAALKAIPFALALAAAAKTVVDRQLHKRWGGGGGGACCCAAGWIVAASCCLPFPCPARSPGLRIC